MYYTIKGPACKGKSIINGGRYQFLLYPAVDSDILAIKQSQPGALNKTSNAYGRETIVIRDYEEETKKRVEFIRAKLKAAGARGVVFGNSGGKDSALVGILCKIACADTVGLIIPCGSKCNYNEDISDAEAVAEQYGIESRIIDLCEAADKIKLALDAAVVITDAALVNIAPRIRMMALYAVAASEWRLVAGTSNRSERYMGYFTKWGDGAYDFNPIADLTVTEIYEFLKHLGAPRGVTEKAPSGGLYDGQTDEAEMGISYRSIDNYLLGGDCSPADLEIINGFHLASEHKRNPPAAFGAEN